MPLPEFVPYFHTYRDDLPQAVGEALEFIRKNQHRLPERNVKPQDSPMFATELLYFVWKNQEQEPAYKEVPDSFTVDLNNLEDVAQHSEWLLSREHLIKHFDVLDMLTKGVVEKLADEMRPINDAITFIPDYPLAIVPAYELLPNPWETVQRVYTLFESYECKRSGIFSRIAHRLGINHYLVTRDVDKRGIRPVDVPYSPKKLIEAYFKDTPLLPLFTRPVPLHWEFKTRYAHTHVIGRTGSGKTSVLERMVAHDLTLKAEPSIVLISPQGDVIRKWRDISDVFADRLTVIDPRDIEYPPAFNPFSVNRERFATYTQADQEQITAGVIQMFDFLFDGFGLELTPKMKTLWSFVVRFFLTFPNTLVRNATIKDVSRLFTRPEEYRDAIEALPETQRDFLERNVLDPKNPTFRETREQLGYRIDRLLADPNLERLLTAPETKLDFFTELNCGAFILIDTAQDFLGDGSTLFGRMMLTIIFQAIVEREVLPETQRHPTFIYVDEAGSYFSAAMDEMLRKARKYHCGLILSHHFMDEAKGTLRPSLISQPSCRFAAPSHEDAKALAPEMKTTADFLTKLKEHHFAAFIRGVTPRAISVKLDIPHPERLTTKAGKEARRWKMRDKVSLGPGGETTRAPSKKSIADEDDGEF